MGSKEGLCLWCGHFTNSRAMDGLADCDTPDCINTRNYENSDDRAGGVKTIEDGYIILRRKVQ